MFLHFLTLAPWEGEGNDHVVQFALTSISVGEEEKISTDSDRKSEILTVAYCLLDQLVRLVNNSRRNCQPDLFCCFEIDDQFKLCRLLDR